MSGFILSTFSFLPPLSTRCHPSQPSSQPMLTITLVPFHAFTSAGTMIQRFIYTYIRTLTYWVLVITILFYKNGLIIHKVTFSSVCHWTGSSGAALMHFLPQLWRILPHRCYLNLQEQVESKKERVLMEETSSKAEAWDTPTSKGWGRDEKSSQWGRRKGPQEGGLSRKQAGKNC